MGFVQRMGLAKANEALIMSKRLGVEELVQCGYVNKVFDTLNEESDKFLELVLKEVGDRLGDHLNANSLIKIKALIRKPFRETLDAQGVAEVRIPSEGACRLSQAGLGLFESLRWEESSRLSLASSSSRSPV